jgi:hypothetical protein
MFYLLFARRWPHAGSRPWPVHSAHTAACVQGGAAGWSCTTIARMGQIRMRWIALAVMVQTPVILVVMAWLLGMSVPLWLAIGVALGVAQFVMFYVQTHYGPEHWPARQYPW